jgi:hypothetical protein
LSQQATYETLCEHLRGPNWINLFGPHGSGKTFTAWFVSRATGMVYVPVPDRLQAVGPAPDGIIVDNSPFREEEVRNLLAQCGLIHCTTVLLITQRPITMPMRRVELPLPTQDEIDGVVHTLARLSYICNRSLLPEKPSLWDVLTACV